MSTTIEENTAPLAQPSAPTWEDDLAALLAALSSAQDELLQLLTEKRDLLVRSDAPALAAMQPREQQLIAKLQQCHQRRLELLSQAAQQGLPSDSIRSLNAALPGGENLALRERIQQAQSRSRLLQHHSLTNWVLVQRTLIHLSQLLEIIATGGRPQPTYGKGEPVNSSGSLLDHAA